jgi:hypothetical protein
MLPNLKERIKSLEHEIFIVSIAILLATLIAGLYILFGTRRQKEPIRYEQNAFTLTLNVGGEGSQDSLFVASKNGTKYYPPGCKAANRIKEENKVFFKSEAEVIKAGFSRTVSC